MVGAPTRGSIMGAVSGGLNVRSINQGMVPTLTFSPSLGIAAGRIAKLGLDIRSFREPIMRSIRQVMVPSIRRNFEEGGRPEPWEPLSDATIEMRTRGDGGDQTLVRTGTLARVASQINIWTVTQTTGMILDLPEKAWYGKVQQSGYGGMGALVRKHGGNVAKASAEHTANLLGALKSGTSITGSGGGVNIPARPFLVFQDEDIDNIHEVFMKWLAERVQLAWPSAAIHI